MALIGGAGQLLAELPPNVYIELRKKAPEVLRIRTDEVISKPAGILDRSNWTETVSATVLEVTRSESGVKKGDVISIVYGRQVPKEGWVGPAPAQQLAKGKEYTAFLAKNEGGGFSIAARGMSFNALK